MPRDGSGNYSLPAGNPVVSGEVITPTWANPTMDDLAVAMTDSLSRTGSGGMLVPFLNADGSVSTPGISFTSEPSSGIYRAASADVRMSVTSQDVARWLSEDNGMEMWDGTAWQKLAKSTGDQTITGIWTHAADLRLENLVSLTGQKVDLTYHKIARIAADDALEIGAASIDDIIVESGVQQTMRIAGASSARIVDRASGSLLIWDTQGNSSAALRSGGAVQNVTGNLDFSARILLDNNIGLEGLALDGLTAVNLIKLTGSDDLNIGNHTEVQTLQLRSAVDISLQAAGTTSAQARVNDIATGGLLVRDRSGVFHKAGFRDQPNRSANTGRTFTQDDEGLPVRKSTATNESYTVPVLEAGTNIVYVNDSANTQTLIQDVGVNLNALVGGAEIVGNLTVAKWSVVNLWWVTTTRVHVWGNGVT